MVFQD
jgi:hypothetical protein